MVAGLTVNGGGNHGVVAGTGRLRRSAVHGVVDILHPQQGGTLLGVLDDQVVVPGALGAAHLQLGHQRDDHLIHIGLHGDVGDLHHILCDRRVLGAVHHHLGGIELGGFAVDGGLDLSELILGGETQGHLLVGVSGDDGKGIHGVGAAIAVGSAGCVEAVVLFHVVDVLLLDMGTLHRGGEDHRLDLHDDQVVYHGLLAVGRQDRDIEVIALVGQLDCAAAGVGQAGGGVEGLAGATGGNAAAAEHRGLGHGQIGLGVSLRAGNGVTRGVLALIHTQDIGAMAQAGDQRLHGLRLDVHRVGDVRLGHGDEVITKVGAVIREHVIVAVRSILLHRGDGSGAEGHVDLAHSRIGAFLIDPDHSLGDGLAHGDLKLEVLVAVGEGQVHHSIAVPVGMADGEGPGLVHAAPGAALDADLAAGGQGGDVDRDLGGVVGYGAYKVGVHLAAAVHIDLHLFQTGGIVVQGDVEVGLLHLDVHIVGLGDHGGRGRIVVDGHADRDLDHAIAVDHIVVGLDRHTLVRANSGLARLVDLDIVNIGLNGGGNDAVNVVAAHGSGHLVRRDHQQVIGIVELCGGIAAVILELAHHALELEDIALPEDLDQVVVGDLIGPGVVLHQLLVDDLLVRHGGGHGNGQVADAGGRQLGALGVIVRGMDVGPGGLRGMQQAGHGGVVGGGNGLGEPRIQIIPDGVEGSGGAHHIRLAGIAHDVIDRIQIAVQLLQVGA